MLQQAMNFLFAAKLSIILFKVQIPAQKLYPNSLSFPLLLKEREPVCRRKKYTLYTKKTYNFSIKLAMSNITLLEGKHTTTLQKTKQKIQYTKI